MQRVDEELERLIVRSLDGETTADEELELSKALLRQPEARDLMDRYRGNDALAAGALLAALGSDRSGSVPIQSDAHPPIASSRRRYRALGYRALVYWAMAASILLMFGSALWLIGNRPAQDTQPPTDDPLMAVRNTNVTGEIPLRPVRELDADPRRYVPQIPHRRNLRSDRELFVIEGEQPDRYYLLERNRTRSMIIPAGFDM